MDPKPQRRSSIPWEDDGSPAAVALDIGGSLCKVAFLDMQSFDAPVPVSDDHSPLPHPAPYPRLHLCYYETSQLEDCIAFLRKRLWRDQLPSRILATGGGAHKFTQLFQATCGITLTKLGELECLVQGCDFMLKNMADEAFTFHAGSSPERRFVQSVPYPFILVNIGSGCSVLLVKDSADYERIDGSAVGGGTFWGLGSLLTGKSEFDEILKQATEGGDSRNVDLLVRDIYGDGVPSSLKLDGDLTASCLGKAARVVDGMSSASKADIASSLLQMVAYNIAQMACLNARLHNVTQIVFAGFFLRGQQATMKVISEAVGYWGRGQISALFLRHEGYLGCIGAFLHNREPWLLSPPPTSPSGRGPTAVGLASVPGEVGAADAVQAAAGSGPVLPDANPPATVSEYFVRLPESSGTLKNFSLEVREPLVPLKQLQPGYVPDTIDLMFDVQAREYWLDLFQNSVDREVQVAKSSTRNGEKRAEAFRQTFLQHLSVLRNDETAYGQLSVRTILELRQQCLREFHFFDPYKDIKRQENEAAMQLLPQRLEELKGFADVEGAVRDALQGACAGNCFDWGAKATAERLEKWQLDFAEEKRKITSQSWLVDDSAAVVARLRATPYKLALIFADNAGADIILGILPFARLLLSLGTRVILAANTFPVLNDICAEELRGVVRAAAELDDVLREAWQRGTLCVMENGTGSPCLDLLRVDWRLVKAAEEADLIVLEGMGRAIHTNYYAKFQRADALKLAMIKNDWLARKLGGKLYDVVCKFEVRGE